MVFVDQLPTINDTFAQQHQGEKSQTWVLEENIFISLEGCVVGCLEG